VTASVTVRFVYINILVMSVENALSEDGTTNYHIHIGPHRPKTAPRILLNGRRIKRVIEFA